MPVHRLVGALATSAFVVVGWGNPLGLVDSWSPGGDGYWAASSAERAAIAGQAPAPEHGPAEAVARGPVNVSLLPKVAVRNATPQQHQRLLKALGRFRSAGLLLPDLEVEFHSEMALCGGHFGVFEPRFTPWRILICSGMDAVYEHELAHAWELANLDDEIRRHFMEHRGHEFWSGPTVPWNERGVEGAAFIIQQGLVPLPLPPALSVENHSRLVAYSILTGGPAPRLLEWVGLDSEQPEPVGWDSLKCLGDACRHSPNRRVP